MSAVPLFSNIKLLQSTMQAAGIDGWLLYDFRATNQPMYFVLNLGQDKPMTRRFFYWLPAKGEPIMLHHAIEANSVRTLEAEHKRHGSIQIFSSAQTLKDELAKILLGARLVAMEISPMAALPYISCVDAGTVQLVESLGPRVVTSQPLLQELLARWDLEGLNHHLAAARAVDEETLHVFGWVHTKLAQGESLNEWQVANYLQERLQNRGMYLDHLPIVGVDGHSADPHYTPRESGSTQLAHGQVLLIDVWCKPNQLSGRYADICRMAYIGDKPSQKHEEIFKIVLMAQTAALDFLRQQLQLGHKVAGYQLDQIARGVIEKAGYGPFFTHRLGHSIDYADHGNGTHLDSLETHDERQLMTRTCFSMEPGIYIPGEFGIRLESDIYMDSKGGCHVTGGYQTHWYCLNPAAPCDLPCATSPFTISL